MIDPTGITPNTRPTVLVMMGIDSDPTGINPEWPAELFIPSAVVLPMEVLISNSPTPPLVLPELVVAKFPRQVKGATLKLKGKAQFAAFIEVFAGRRAKNASRVRRVRVNGKRWRTTIKLEPGRNVFSVQATNTAGKSTKRIIEVIRRN